MKLFKSQPKAQEDKRISVNAVDIQTDIYSESLLLMDPVTDDENHKAERAIKLRANNLTSAQDYKECAEHESRRLAKNNCKYYSRAYPQYKFVDESIIEAICKKYGLLFGDMEKYTGSIPDKNLDDLLNAKIKDNDHFCIHVTNTDWSWGSMELVRDIVSLYGQEVYDKINDKEKVKITERKKNGSQYQYTVEVFAQKQENNARGLMIAAPVSMFKDINQNSTIESGYRIVDKDPIVFYKVVGGYLIITAWGDEANIPEIVNEKMN